MKLLWILLAVLVLVGADDEEDNDSSNSQENQPSDHEANDEEGEENEIKDETEPVQPTVIGTGDKVISYGEESDVNFRASGPQGRTRSALINDGHQSPSGGSSRYLGSPVGLGSGFGITGGFNGLQGIPPGVGHGFGGIGGLEGSPLESGYHGVGGLGPNGFGVSGSIGPLGVGINGVGGGFNGLAGAISNTLGGLGGNNASPSTCRYWCRTPRGQVYCCEGADEPQSFVVFVKPGFCPPVRPSCPPIRNFLPPATCSNDGRCGGVEKCCFDTCLQEHVCKPPLGIGF